MFVNCRDLKQLSAIEPKLSAAANCAALYIQCQLLLAKVSLEIFWNFFCMSFFIYKIFVKNNCISFQIISNKNWLNPSLLSPLQSSSLKSSIEQVYQIPVYFLIIIFLIWEHILLYCFINFNISAPTTFLLSESPIFGVE